MRKVAVITGTRAEYGLLYWLLMELRSDPAIKLQLVACAAHLSPEFGLTYQTIIDDGFEIDARVDMLLSGDTPVAVAKSVGLGCIGFADAFATLKPDIVVVLGDRFEIIAAAFAALAARIPVAHIAGGERTEGAIDESIRHAITKMAHLHFTGAEEYRGRVIQMGEQADRVFNVGALGLDAISRMSPMSPSEVGKTIGFPLEQPYFTVTYHPETLAGRTAVAGLREMLEAIDCFPSYQAVVTAPNADVEGRAVMAELQEYAQRQPRRVHFCLSLGSLRYLSLVRGAAAVIGNSSSGLYEAPALGTPTVNIGDRQRGRIRPDSVINATADAPSIRMAIGKAIDPQFRRSFAGVKNPFGDGNAAERIAAVLRSANLKELGAKRFHDIPLPQATPT